MHKLIDIPVASVMTLTPESAVAFIRAILRSECAYAKLSPSVLTISSRITTPDGGIDAEINTPPKHSVPSDCLFQAGLTGFQIKSGTSFKPWERSAIRTELLNKAEELKPEVERLVQRGGCYTLICTGHDLTPPQRNNAQQEIVTALAEKGFEGYAERIDVLGASQLAEFAECYPGVASLLIGDPIQEAWVLETWQRDAHMANAFEESPEQSELIAKIRSELQSETKHIRILGEPGLGKTRIVLEAVKDENIAPYVLYIEHGSQFGQTSLFRQLLKSDHTKPLVLVIDELPESELSDIWRHLKPRCGQLKIVSLDHGRDETHDEEIERFTALRLTDETIKKILASRIGASRELDRWAAICEGSPRVAQAVADNLHANPDDILKPPATVPIWTRFLHGYSSRDANSARQIDCVSQHLALFSRFGYEAPVDDEANYTFDLIRAVDPSIGQAQFQEIIQSLRARRVLQGSRTLFFVPKALHIYLWKQFWKCYGRGFDFSGTFNAMPTSLHTWFMNMFKYAGGAPTDHVIDDILKPDGIFAQRAMLTSDKGSQFLSILAEANPAAVLKLLESTVAQWADQELLDVTEHRQNLVWTLEKIAVWPTLTIRTLRVLTRLAINENANNANNATGTLVGLFRIGPEWAATEASPEARLPAMQELFRSPKNAERCLGLKAMCAALDDSGMAFRVIGPEYQGLKERAKLWTPTTYNDWWQAKYRYFQALVDETKDWPSALRPEVCNALLNAVEQQITTPPCTELAFQVLTALASDTAMQPTEINRFFRDWKQYEDSDEHLKITKRLQNIERLYTRRNLASRFQRYVIDVDWMESDENLREKHGKPKNRAKLLVDALARRIARHPEKLNEVKHLLASEKNAFALWHFGEQLAKNDVQRTLLPILIQLALEKKHQVCLHGYLSVVQNDDPDLYFSTLKNLLNTESTAWLGATIALNSGYNDGLFVLCLDALEKRWIAPTIFAVLRFGKAIKSIPADKTRRLFHQLHGYGGQEAQALLIHLLNSITFNEACPVNPEFVFEVVSITIPGTKNHDETGYYWKNVCEKLVEWDECRTLPLLNTLLTEMHLSDYLTYDSHVAPLADELVRTDPMGAWKIVKTHLEETLPKWRGDLLHWLKGGLGKFDGQEPRGAIADLPAPEILTWIEQDPEPRAALMAHAVPATLDDEQGGRLTRELLSKYGHYDRVRNSISATFHSGGGMGLRSTRLKRKRDKLRRWLAADFDSQTMQWIEAEIEHLDKWIEQEEISEERSHFE